MATSRPTRQRGRPGRTGEEWGGDPRSPVERDDPRSTGEVIRDITDGVRQLVRQEVAVTKQQVGQGASAAGRAAGAGVAAAVLILFAVGFLGVALGNALTGVVADWLAWLIVAGVFLLLAGAAGGAAAVAGRRSGETPQRLQESLKEDLEWIRQVWTR